MPGKVIRFAFPPECFCSLTKKVKRRQRGLSVALTSCWVIFPSFFTLFLFFFSTPTESLYLPFLLSLPGAGSACLSLRVFSATFSLAARPTVRLLGTELSGQASKWQTPALQEATAFLTRTSGLHFRNSNYMAHTAFKGFRSAFHVGCSY